MKNIFKNLQQITYIGAGVAAHHYGSKLLDSSATNETNKMEAIRDQNISKIKKSVEYISENIKSLENKTVEGVKTSEVEGIQFKIEETKKSMEEIRAHLDKGITESAESQRTEVYSQIGDKVSQVNDNLEKITEFIDKINGKGPGNNLMPIYNQLTDYLDGLSLLQESSLVHICIFVVIILTLINIIIALFGNELIKIFNLEAKYPSLAIFFKLRIKFQRYYLIMSFLALIIICIVGISLDLIAFLYH